MCTLNINDSVTKQSKTGNKNTVMYCTKLYTIFNFNTKSKENLEDLNYEQIRYISFNLTQENYVICMCFVVAENWFEMYAPL